jgi:hypothetical protein
VVYKGGKGILVRSPFDGYQEDQMKNVVPSTFWSNDIFSPSQIYAGWGGGDGNPWCPDAKGTANCPTDGVTGDDGPFNSIQIAYVINKQLTAFYKDWNDVQSEQWGNGVFYPTDSNSCDKRCAYFDSENGYDCPGGWIDKDKGSWEPNPQKKANF